MHRIIYRQMEHMINREKKLAEEKKKRKVCVSMGLNCTHMCRAAHARALVRLSDVNPGLFHFEYVNFNLPVTRSVRQPALSSTPTALQSVNWPGGTLTLATQSARQSFNQSVS